MDGWYTLKVISENDFQKLFKIEETLLLKTSLVTCLELNNRYLIVKLC